MSESCRREEKKPISTSAAEVEGDGEGDNNERIDCRASSAERLFRTRDGDALSIASARCPQLIMSENKSHSSLNPKTTSYEFLGPPGALAITFGVPILAYVLYFACNESSGGCPPPIQSLYPSLVQAVSDPAFWWKLWDPKAFAIYYSWYAFCLVTWAVLPGDWVQGTQLRNGKYQQYKINGAISFSTRRILFDLN